MKVKFNEFLATVYASLFDFPLSASEAKLWAVGNNKREVPFVGFAALQDNDRKKRRETSLRKHKEAVVLAETIGKLPTVRGVFLTGSVAVCNALPKADIDFMIVTQPNTLWMTRAIVVTILKLKGRYRSGNKIANQVCTNIFLDLNNLRVEEKNLFTAHEILQAECLFDAGGVARQWLKQNDWVRRFLPNAFREKLAKANRVSLVVSSKSNWGFVLFLLELLALVTQFLYMRPRKTREKIAWGKAIFHPNDLTEKIFQKWSAKLVSLKYNRTEATDIFFFKS